MKTFYIIFFIYLFTICNSFSQSYSSEWAVTYNAYESSDDQSTKMTVDSAGNVYVTGKSWAYEDTYYDYLTVKYNTSGVLQWQVRYNGPGNYTDQPTGIVVDKSGNVYVTGFSYGGSSDYDYATVKYNSNGVQQWVDRYNGPADSTDKANSIALDKSSNVIVTGESRKNSANFKFDCTSIKYSPSGIRSWINRYEYQSTNHCYGMYVKIDTVGNVYIGCEIIDVGFNGIGCLSLKYNTSGVQQWVYVYPLSYQIRDYELDLSGNIFTTTDLAKVFKINSAGTLIGSYTLPFGSVGYGTSCLDFAGNFYSTSTGSPDNVSFLRKFNNIGIVQWTQAYFLIGASGNIPQAIEVDSSGNIFITGKFYYPSGPDIVTFKFNSSGIKQWTSRYLEPFFDETTSGIALDYHGNVYVSGSTIIPGTEYDYLTIKYPSSLQLNAKILMEGFYNNITNTLSKKDTLTAYLRNTTFPYAIVDSGKALIDTLSFKCGFCFNNAPAGTYYIAIKHRNSIETWSKVGGEVFSKSSPVYYDFTASASQAYGSNLVLKGSKYCMYSGNINQDGIIDASDQSQVDNDSFSGLSGIFLNSDVNGDSFVDATDVGIVDNNRSVVINRPYF